MKINLYIRVCGYKKIDSLVRNLVEAGICSGGNLFGSAKKICIFQVVCIFTVKFMEIRPRLIFVNVFFDFRFYLHFPDGV